MRGTALVVILGLLGGCAHVPKEGLSSDGPLVSHLTLAQVREAASARARENGFAVDASMPWRLSLSAAQRPYVWTAILQAHGQPPAGFWLLINDATGQADFVMPAVATASGPPAGSDWLVRVKNGIRQAKYPIRLEDFLREVHATGLQADSGGSTPDGRSFLEFTLRREADGPARFELRCYIITPEGWTGPKIVTEAELAYIDDAINRYVLSDGNN